MKILITGAAGFISRILIDELQARNHELVLLDRVDPQEASIFVPGSAERKPLPLITEWPYLRGEITDVDFMRGALQGVDAIIHLAASVSGIPEIGVETFRVNALGTFVVLDEARKAGVQRFLCASSINAFGTFYWRLSGQPVPYTQMPLDETFPPIPEDPYSLSKLVNEETCAAFTRAYGLTTAAFRFAGMWSDEMYQQRLGKLQPTTQWSDDIYQWAHVNDIVMGLRLAVEAPDLPSFGVYTLSGADTRCPEPTIELLQRFKPELAVTKKLEGRAPLLSIDRARAAFGYAPKYRLGD